MSFDVSHLSLEKSASVAAAISPNKMRSVSHSPPRLAARRMLSHSRGMRGSSSPQIPPEIPELGCQPIFSNSSVSLNSVCLNKEIFEESSENIPEERQDDF